MNIHSSLIAELRDKSYRDAYVASQIRMGLPFQIRALRISRGWTQLQLAEAAGMSQPRIAEIEKGKRSLNLETLLRLASAFDVGLDVFFASFGDLVDRKESFEPDTFDALSFSQEIAEAEQRAKAPETAVAAATGITTYYTCSITTGYEITARGTFVGGVGTPTVQLNPGDAIALTLTTANMPKDVVIAAANQKPSKVVSIFKDAA